MTEVNHEISGDWNILFVGRDEYIRVKLAKAVRDHRGDFLYLQGVDETIYNWTNILIMRRAK